jgi:serine/threonine protein phosphatase 1
MNPLPQSTPKIHYYDFNPNGATYVCGDIHGCYNELILALKAIGFDFSNDLLFSLGDIVDRGTDDYLSMSLIYKPWFRMVKGNHECLHEECYLQHPSNGTYWALPYKHNKDQGYLNFLSEVANLPHAIIIDNRYVLIHAALPMIAYSGLAKVVDIKQTLHEYDFWTELFRPDPTLWDTSEFHRPHVATLPGIDRVFHGHHIQPTITIKGKATYLDTGFRGPTYSKSYINKLSFAILKPNDEPIYLTVSVDFDISRVVDIEIDATTTIP